MPINVRTLETNLPPADRDQPLQPSSNHPLGSGLADRDLAAAGTAGREPSHVSPNMTSTSTNLPSTDRDLPLPPSSHHPMGSGLANLAAAATAGSECNPSADTQRSHVSSLIGICVSCGRDIPYGVCYKELLEGGNMCSFCHDPTHAESKYGGDSYPDPVRKRGVHVRFLENGGVHTRFPDDDSASASDSSESFGSASEFFS